MLPSEAGTQTAARPAGDPRLLNPDKYVGPAGLLQAYRFLVDSRDQASAAQLDEHDPNRLFHFRTAPKA